MIPNGGSVNGTIAIDGETDTHTFDGVAGQEGVISISGDVIGGEFYRVFNPDGTQLLDDANQAFLVLPQTGTYTVIVSSFQASGTGNYAVHLALAPGANEHGLIPNGGSAAQNIGDNGEIDSFTFTGAAGQQGAISITGNVIGGEFMLIFNPAGTLLDTTSSQTPLNLPQDGTYTVVVRSFQASGTGSYVINLVLDPLPTPVVVFMPGVLEFGDLALSAGRTETVTVANGGDGTLRPSMVSIVGRDPADFTVLADTCIGAKLSSAQTCGIEIRFMPGAPGLRQA
ncbi:MAG: hypothetical protein ACPGJE_03840, partial [Wenzhouxiangellaceae bacterium]